MGEESPRGQGEVLKWLWQRLRDGRAPDPPPEELPRAEPELAEPRVAPESGDLRVTWVGHATFLVQLPGVTVLTDPMFSRRASPVQWAGPRRFSPPGLSLDELPTVDAVVLSHDHYDHLDRPTVDRLKDRYDALHWVVPRGFAEWLAGRGVDAVTELDWWEDHRLETERGALTLRALPARHWTRRRLFDARKRLWCSWSLEAGGRRVYFGGDSAYSPGFAEIGERAGPFDVALLPVGAYEPRWFMRSSHMNPEEAVQAYRDVRAGAMVGMHWGTFRLTDEPPLEPPRRSRRAWADLGLPPEDLYIPALGQTVRF
jgi:N-acyl-phosphatidylethanolamine-hydrolysing phospholipase D